MVVPALHLHAYERGGRRGVGGLAAYLATGDSRICLRGADLNDTIGLKFLPPCPCPTCQQSRVEGQQLDVPMDARYAKGRPPVPTPVAGWLAEEGKARKSPCVRKARQVAREQGKSLGLGVKGWGLRVTDSDQRRVHRSSCVHSKQVVRGAVGYPRQKLGAGS